ncbi:AMP-binding protein, partial [Arthrobacter sp. H41]|uniref:AMP-binding protein n=1 Tax=Arthrobacter sp. H41 TaxID=1312978 RepID=UPI00047EA8E9
MDSGTSRPLYTPDTPRSAPGGPEAADRYRALHRQNTPGSAPGGPEAADRYRALHRRSIEDPATFWLDAAEAVSWTTVPGQALDSSRAPLYRWFPGARLNTSFNALDRHVLAGRGDTTALVYDSAMLGTQQHFTYAQLRDEVAQFAGALRNQGVAKGDRVLIYLPMVPEAVIAMLAVARLGAVHSVVFGGFAPAELASRIRDAGPKVVLTASGGLEP